MEIKRWILIAITIGIFGLGILMIVSDLGKAPLHSIYEYDGTLGLTSETNIEKQKKLESILAAEYPGFVIWGDSLTQRGIASCFEEALQQNVIDPVNQKIAQNGMLGSYKISIPVINMGVGSETSAMIAARSGAIPYILLEDLDIPCDTSDIPISVGLQDGSTPRIKFGREGTGLESVEIMGITGVISSGSNGQYVFHRLTAGTELTVASGTPVISAGAILYQHMIPIIYMGTNGGYHDDSDELVQQQQAMLDYIDGPADKYIIVGIHTGDAETRKELEMTMESVWGDHYINLRRELVMFDYGSLGISLDSDDQKRIAQGECPNAILASDGLHFNNEGYQVAADIIYKHMDKLLFFDEMAGSIVACANE